MCNFESSAIKSFSPTMSTRNVPRLYPLTFVLTQRKWKFVHTKMENNVFRADTVILLLSLTAHFQSLLLVYLLLLCVFAWVLQDYYSFQSCVSLPGLQTALLVLVRDKRTASVCAKFAVSDADFSQQLLSSAICHLRTLYFTVVRLLSIYSTPVSYTHLDVYKRQFKHK